MDNADAERVREIRRRLRRRLLEPSAWAGSVASDLEFVLSLLDTQPMQLSDFVPESEEKLWT